MMAPTKSANDLDPTLAYILLVLSTAKSFKAKYRAFAAKAGIAGHKNA